MALVESNGSKRNISSVLETIAQALAFIPGLEGVSAWVSTIAGWLGGVGVLHGGLNLNLAKIPLSSLAAFINALAVAAESLPWLLPYKDLLKTLGALLSALVTGTLAQSSYLGRKYVVGRGL